MTRDEWKTQWQRLDQFRVSGDANRSDVSAEWFRQLQHWHVDAIDSGITQLIGSAKDTFLPGLGLLKEFIRSRMSSHEHTPGKCQTCHGSGWVEAAPFMSNSLVYANVLSRCMDCGIPAPKVESHSRRQPLTDLQAHEYGAGRFGRDRMPDGCKAKHPERGNPELKTAMEALRQKLFGVAEEIA